MCVLRGAHVIACDMSAARLEAAKKLGAVDTVKVDEVEDQAQAVKDLTEDGRGVDVAIEATGVPSVWESAMHMARPGGFVLLFGGLKKAPRFRSTPTSCTTASLRSRAFSTLTPMYVHSTFEMIKMGQFPEEIFVQNEYSIDDTEKAILEHASGAVIKNAIVYPD